MAERKATTKNKQPYCRTYSTLNSRQLRGPGGVCGRSKVAHVARVDSVDSQCWFSVGRPSTSFFAKNNSLIKRIKTKDFPWPGRPNMNCLGSPLWPHSHPWPRGSQPLCLRQCSSCTHSLALPNPWWKCSALRSFAAYGLKPLPVFHLTDAFPGHSI